MNLIKPLSLSLCICFTASRQWQFKTRCLRGAGFKVGKKIRRAARLRTRAGRSQPRRSTVQTDWERVYPFSGWARPSSLPTPSRERMAAAPGVGLRGALLRREDKRPCPRVLLCPVPSHKPADHGSTRLISAPALLIQGKIAEFVLCFGSICFSSIRTSNLIFKLFKSTQLYPFAYMACHVGLFVTAQSSRVRIDLSVVQEGSQLRV